MLNLMLTEESGAPAGSDGLASHAAPATLLAIGGLRVAWGLGTSWPRINRDRADPAARFAVEI
jgi:hypothetical protein